MKLRPPASAATGPQTATQRPLLVVKLGLGVSPSRSLLLPPERGPSRPAAAPKFAEEFLVSKRGQRACLRAAGRDGSQRRKICRRVSGFQTRTALAYVLRAGTARGPCSNSETAHATALRPATSLKFLRWF